MTDVTVADVGTTILDDRPLECVQGQSYLALPRDPQPWIVQQVIPLGGLVNVMGKPKLGKALALDTPVRTPDDGWRTIGEIETGDYVYGSTGQPIRVLGVSPVEQNRTCYKVTFSNGESIVADAQHLWQVERAVNERITRVMTTQEIVNEGLTHKSGTYTKAKWRIRLAAPLQFPVHYTDLPMHPYLLGLWLGDGTQSNSQYTSADPELVEMWRKCGWVVSKQPSNKYGYGVRGLKAKLIEMGLLNNKHIPLAYMQGSVYERQLLLCGLLDTDGGCESGQAVFYNTNEILANQVYELACGLGMRVKRSSKIGKINGVPHKRCYVVRMRGNFVPFNLDRKAKLFRPTDELYYVIKSIEPVESVPVKCLVVDAPDRLFLAGRCMVPTHNSFLGLGLAIAVSDPSVSEWMGFPVLRHGPVLYVQIDTPRSFWADRIDKLVRIGGHNIDNIWWTDALMAPYPFDVMQRKVVDQIKDKVAAIQPVMVVFDTLREIHQLDENDNTAMKQVLTNVVYTTRGTDATVVFISHTRKEQLLKGGGKPRPDSGDGDLMNDGRGASYVSGRMDVLMKLTDKRLIMKGRGLVETKLNVEQDDKTGMIVLNKDKEEADQQIKLVLAMPGLNKTQQAETLAEMAGLKLAGAKARIDRYVQREREHRLLLQQDESEGSSGDE